MRPPHSTPGIVQPLGTAGRVAGRAQGVAHASLRFCCPSECVLRSARAQAPGSEAPVPSVGPGLQESPQPRLRFWSCFGSAECCLP